jgi:hypothetical protein
MTETHVRTKNENVEDRPEPETDRVVARCPIRAESGDVVTEERCSAEVRCCCWAALE